MRVAVEVVERMHRVAPCRGPAIGGEDAFDRRGIGGHRLAVDQQRKLRVWDGAIVGEGEGLRLGHLNFSTASASRRSRVTSSDLERPGQMQLRVDLEQY